MLSKSQYMSYNDNDYTCSYGKSKTATDSNHFERSTHARRCPVNQGVPGKCVCNLDDRTSLFNMARNLYDVSSFLDEFTRVNNEVSLLRAQYEKEFLNIREIDE
jgi:hypothetical protein